MKETPFSHDTHPGTALVPSVCADAVSEGSGCNSVPWRLALQDCAARPSWGRRRQVRLRGRAQLSLALLQAAAAQHRLIAAALPESRGRWGMRDSLP